MPREANCGSYCSQIRLKIKIDLDTIVMNFNILIVSIYKNVYKMYL